MKDKRPFITIKIAQTFDGKIAASGGRSRWITGPQSRAFVHQLRAQHDAVLVGKSTFNLDKPRLSSLKKGNPVWKIVLGSADMLPIRNNRIFDQDSRVVFVVSSKELSLWLKQKNLQSKNCLFLTVRKSASKGFDLHDLMNKLFYMGIRKLMVEGGGEVFASFLNARLADRIYWMMAPKVIGGRDAKTSVEGDGVKDPNKAINLKILRVTKLGHDYCFMAKLN
ncbi:MAG TPA: RibD family protein [Candidatus Omnitrophota bacterium]|nr:RibD family protein [Candidatus Omnitrophota bacterium]